MKEKIKNYMQKLEAGIADYMTMPVNERSASAITSMEECWEHMDALIKHLDRAEGFSKEEAVSWVSSMQNEDGTTGEHWTIEETTALAEKAGVTFEHVTNYIWWAVVNMMRSDYFSVAEKYRLDVAEFYADLAKKFLFDKDAPSPEKKVAAYYHGIVE